MRPATSRPQVSWGGKANRRKGERTRDEIIRRAVPIFNQRGYEGAALSDLMEAFINKRRAVIAGHMRPGNGDSLQVIEETQ